jgi:hypothetical protein
MIPFQKHAGVFLFETHEKVQSSTRILTSIDVVAEKNQGIVDRGTNSRQQTTQRTRLAVNVPEDQQPRYDHFSPSVCQNLRW